MLSCCRPILFPDSMLRHPYLLLRACALAFVLAGPVAAQDVTLPADVYHILLDRAWYGDDDVLPTVTVGAVPDSLRARLPVLPKAEVQMTLSNASETVLYLRTTTPREAVLAYYRQALPASGWTARMPDTTMGRVRGFIAPLPPVTGLDFCGSGDTTLVVFVPDKQNPYDVRLSMGTSGWACQPENRTASPQDLPFPTLVAPPGTKTHPGGSSMSGGCRGEFCGRWAEGETRASLDTSETPAALVAHYATQLLAQGWTLVDTAVGARYALSGWRMTDADGLAWWGELKFSPAQEKAGYEATFALTSAVSDDE